MNDGRWDEQIDRYFLRSMQIAIGKKWKEMEDKKGISKDAHLEIELSKLPVHWRQAICQNLGYINRMSRNDQIFYISNILRNRKFLKKILVELSRSSLFILKYLLSRGGWATFQQLSRQANTDESGDSWWWDEDPPSSPLGQLRARALVFVGKAPVKNKLYKIAVIPRELREILKQLLPEVYKLKDKIEQRRALQKSFSSKNEEDYLELLEEVKDYFEDTDWFSLIKGEQIINFLKYLRNKNLPYEEIDQAWEYLQYFLNFVDHYSFSKESLEDFKAWEFSYFLLDFIPSEYGESALIYEEVRQILYILSEFYKYLKKQGEIKSDAEIQKAITCILKDDGKISRIPAPPARGPEALLMVTVPGYNKELIFTNNDLWCSIVLYLEYDEDLQSMISDLERGEKNNQGIVDAKKKKEHLLQLRKKLEKGKMTPYQLLSYLKPTKKDIEKAIRWFYKKKILT